MYELVGTKKVEFTGSDGNRVCGVRMYFTYAEPGVDGLSTERVFVSMDRYHKLTFVPELGGACDLRYNKYGRVADIVPA